MRHFRDSPLRRVTFLSFSAGPAENLAGFSPGNRFGQLLVARQRNSSARRAVRQESRGHRRVGCTRGFVQLKPDVWVRR